MNTSEYVFDILSECVRLNIIDFHLIIKRHALVQLFHSDLIAITNQKCSSILCIINFDLNYFEGTMIILNNSHLSDELTVKDKDRFGGNILQYDYILARNLTDGCSSISRFKSNWSTIYVCEYVRHSSFISFLFVRKEVKYLLPASVLKLKNIHPQEWTATVNDKLHSSVESLSTIEAKIKFLSNSSLK